MLSSLPTRSLLLVPVIVIVLTLVSSAQPIIEPSRIELAWPKVTVMTRVFCGTTPLDNLVESNFELYENGKRIDQYTLKCSGSTREECCMSIGLVADRSGSMGWNSPSGMEIMKSGFKTFIDKMDGGCDEATLISFSNTVTVDVFMTNDKVLLTAGIDGLTSNGATAAWDAGVTGVQEVANNSTQPCRAVVLLTDGEDNSSSNTADDLISLAIVNKIRVFTIALGPGTNEEILQRIAQETGGLFYKVGTNPPNQITQTMKIIAEAIHSKFGECTIEYASTCMDGSRRQVDLIVKNVPTCLGADTTSKTYKAPKDTSTYAPIGIMLGSSPADLGHTVLVPLLLGTAMHDVFNTATFKILFDTQKAKLLQVETSGYLLDSASCDFFPINGGYQVTLRNSKLINGSGILAMLTFEAIATTPAWTTCALELVGWTFTAGCYQPILTSGELTNAPTLILERPAGGEMFCAGDDITIKWYSNFITEAFIDISSDSGKTFTPLTSNTSKLFTWRIPLSMQPGRYIFRVRDANNQHADKMHVPFTVLSPPVILKHPANVALCSGQTATFDSKSNSSQSYIIWQQSIDNGASWQGISGAPASESLMLRNVKASDDGKLVRALHYNQCNLGTPSNGARISVLSLPTFEKQPSDTSVCEGYRAKFSIQPRTGSQSTVKWQKSTNAGATFTDIPGASFWDYTITHVLMAENGERYRVILTNACGEDTSRAVTLTVMQGTRITSQPKARIACEGDSVKLSVSVSPAVGCQWFKDGIALPGKTNTLLDLGKVTPADAGKYFARIAGNCGPLDSDTASVSVYAATKITGHPTSQTVNERASVTFTVVAAGTNLRYQWMKNGVPIPNATGPSLTISSVVKADEGEYTVLIHGDCGADMVSNAARLSVTIVSARYEPVAPRVAMLHQNVPNPFSSTSEIGFTVYAKTEIEISVHDLLGRTIETLVDRSYIPGVYAVRIDARKFKPGMYLYTMKTPTQTEHRRMMIVK